MAALALLVVLSGLNGNAFVTPRVFFGLARDGWRRLLARVSAGGSPWTSTLLVGVVARRWPRRGTFEWLLSLAIILVLAIDGFMVPVLFRLRRREGPAPFPVPLYPFLPLLFLAIYVVLFVAAALRQPARPPGPGSARRA